MIKLRSLVCNGRGAVQFQTQWSALSTEKQIELLPLIIRWYLENWRLRSRSYLETEVGGSDVTIGLEFEYQNQDTFNYLKSLEVAKHNKIYLPESVNFLLPYSGQIAATAPVNNTQLDREKIGGTVEIITGPSNASSRVALTELMKFVRLDEVDDVSASNAHITIGGVVLDQEHPELIEAKALLSTFPPQLSEAELSMMRSRHMNQRNCFQDRFEKTSPKGNGKNEFIPYFKRRKWGSDKIVQYRVSNDVVELRSFLSFHKYDDWFTSFCRQTNYLLAMAKGIAATQISEGERDMFENQMAKAWILLLAEWSKLKQKKKLHTPPYSKFFIEYSQPSLLARLRVIIDKGGGDKIRDYLDKKIIELQKKNPDFPDVYSNLISLKDHLFNSSVAPFALYEDEINQLLTFIGAKNAPYMYYERVMYESIVDHEFNAEMRRILREYRRKIREIESKKFEHAREEQRQRVLRVSESIRTILVGP